MYSSSTDYIYGFGNNGVILNSDDDFRVITAALPREFRVIHESKVPLLQNVEDPSPDFIIIAEFSELEGPVPLVTIPITASSRSELDLGNLAVHLMSTDYQVNLVGHFKICEDTQVLRKNVFKNIHVFMEYFTLYDIKARGFVRPFCFGYVSRDHVKLDKKLDTLIKEFDKMTKVLKHSNRKWFAGELEIYLERLRRAKENLIKEEEKQPKKKKNLPSQEDSDDEDPDVITLEQIAHQFSEIENILRIVKAFDSSGLEEELSSISRSPYLDKLSLILGLGCGNECPLNLPLVHPLKPKGEPLRPLTTLGQLGTIYLVQKLMEVYQNHHIDLIYSLMEELSTDFKHHCRQNNQNQESTFQKVTNGKMVETIDLNNSELITILDKIHNYTSDLTDNKSASSYHTVSEEDSEAPFPSTPKNDSNGNKFNEPNSSPTSASLPSPPKSDGSSPNFRQSMSSFSSSGADIDMLLPNSNSNNRQTLTTTETPDSIETFKTQPWHHYIQSNLVRGTPGYGILKFFRNYSKIAHHILYSVLIGRAIVIYGSEEQKGKINRIITALVPFVPSKDESWSALRWHRGILVHSHIQRYKLIGLCIPERLEITDMIHPRDDNFVTILNISTKTILGPAYSGNYLRPFEPEKSVSKFHQSDLSLLCYIGSILTEIETKIYMIKSIEETKKGKKINFKDLSLTASDIEIVRHLSGLINTPDMTLDVL